MLQRALPGCGLTVLVLFATLLAFIGVPILPVVIVVGALAAYQYIGLRLRVVDLAPEQRQPFMRPHLIWLAITAGCGLAVGLLALVLRAQLGFSALAALALIGVGALALAVRRAITEGNI